MRAGGYCGAGAGLLVGEYCCAAVAVGACCAAFTISAKVGGGGGLWASRCKYVLDAGRNSSTPVATAVTPAVMAPAWVK